MAVVAPFVRYVISATRAQNSAVRTKRAPLASLLITVIYVIAMGVASGEVATEHCVLRPIA